jgi:hypothetical protein
MTLRPEKWSKKRNIPTCFYLLFLFATQKRKRGNHGKTRKIRNGQGKRSQCPKLMALVKTRFLLAASSMTLLRHSPLGFATA